MAFIETVAEDEADGPLAALYAAERERLGYLPNFARAFSARPEVFRAWQQLNGAIKRGMDERRYELVTLAAARRLRSSYCSLAHGELLAARFLDPEAVRELASGGRAPDPVDAAVMDLAEKVVVDATSVDAADIARLRDLGLSDADILDVVARRRGALLLQQDARRRRRRAGRALPRARARPPGRADRRPPHRALSPGRGAAARSGVRRGGLGSAPRR